MVLEQKQVCNKQGPKAIRTSVCTHTYRTHTHRSEVIGRWFDTEKEDDDSDMCSERKGSENESDGDDENPQELKEIAILYRGCICKQNTCK